MNPAVAWQTTFQAYPDMVFLLDDRERISWMNAAAGKALGRSLEDVQGRFAAEIIWGRRAPDDPLEARARKKRGIEHEIIEVARLEEIWEITKTPLRDDHGKVVGTLLIARDVTESHRDEEALHESEKRYRELVNAIQEGLGMVDEWDVIQYCNPALAQIFEVPADDLVGSHLRDFLDEDSWREFEGKAPDRRTSRDAVYELTIWTGQGNRRRIQVNASPRYDMAGKYLGASILVQDITQRKDVEDALRASEEKFRSICTESPIGIELYDSQGHLCDANKAASEIFGVVDFSEIWGFRLFEDPNVPDEEKDRLRKGETIRYEVPFDFEKVKQHKLYRTTRSGIVHIDVIITPLGAHENKPPKAYLVQVQDITERKQAETALRSERDKLQALVDGLTRTDIGIDIVGIDYKILFQNQTLKVRFGDLCGETCYEQYMGLKKPCDFCPMMKCVKSHQVETIELTGSDGRDYQVLSAPLPNPDGTIDKAIEVVQDITERKQAENALRESEERYRQLVEMSPDAIVILQDGRHRFINAAFTEIFGYTQEDVERGLSLLDLVQEHDKEAVRHRVEKRLVGEQVPRIFRIDLIAKGGKLIPCETSAALIQYQGRPADLVVMRDITERKKAEDALRESENKFRTLAEESFDGIAIHDKGVLLETNKTLARLWGYEPSELVGMHAKYLVAPESYESLMEAILSQLEKPYEALGMKKDGTVFPMEIVGRKITYGGREARITTVRDISERKQAEEALKESEQKFRSITDTAKDAIIMLDNDGRISHWNPEAEQMFGHTSQEALGKQMHALLAPERYHEAFRNGFGAFATTGQGPVVRNTIELEAIRKNGTEFPIEVSLSAVQLNSQWHAVGIVRDVTERKRAEEALRQSKENYRELADSITDVFFAMNRDLRYIYWNKASEKLTGIKAKQAIDKSIFEVFPDTEDTRRTAAMYEKVLKTGQRQNFEQKYQLGGKDSSFEISAYPSARGLSVFVKDITQRKQAENALQESEQKFRSITNAAQDPIIMVDDEGRISYWNRAAEEVFGYASQEAIGREYAHFVSAEYHEAYRQAFDEFARNGRGDAVGRTIELDMIRKDGMRFPAEISTATVQIKGHWHGVGIVRDITQRKRAEEALREHADQMRLVTDALPALTSYVDSEQHYRFNNRAYEEWFGRSREDTYGKHVKDILGASAYRTIQKHIEAALSGQEVHYERPVPYRDGGERMINATYIPHFGKERRVEGFFAFVQDITDRKRAEDALCESEERYRVLFNSGRDLVFVTDMTSQSMPGRIIEVNDFACQRLGYTREELSNLSALDLAPRDKLDGYRPLVGKFLADKAIIFETLALAKDGTEIPIEISAHIFELKGRLLVLSIARDITGRHRAEEALRETEEKYRKLAETRGW